MAEERYLRCADCFAFWDVEMLPEIVPPGMCERCGSKNVEPAGFFARVRAWFGV